MSLGVFIKCPEGLVLASDTRATVIRNTTQSDSNASSQRLFHYDHASKLFTFPPPNNFIGVLAAGWGGIGGDTISSLMLKFRHTLGDKRLSVEKMAVKLNNFLMATWLKETDPQKGRNTNLPSPNLDMEILVAGFDKDTVQGKLFKFSIPSHPKPRELLEDAIISVSWLGDGRIPMRMLQGFDNNLLMVLQKELALDPAQMKALSEKLGSTLALPLPGRAMGLQDFVDLAVLLIHTTMRLQSLLFIERSVGGTIEVAVITPEEGVRFLNKLSLKANLS